jgi:thiamine biosynthesis lipoprotein
VQLLDPQARIDLGGIAKGYIADKLVELFVQRGAQDVFVNLGGNVKVLGHNDKGAPWSVGVRDPQSADAAKVVARILTSDGSVVTSGLYERSFERDGRRYWHILDPRTGHPVKTNVVSASIFSTDSIDGDGYTKPLFMMGADEARAWLASHSELQVLLVDAQGDMTMWPEDSFELL